MTGIGNEESSFQRISEQLTRVEQWAIGLALQLRGERDGPEIETAILFELDDHLSNGLIHCLELEFAFVATDDLATRIDEHQGRPGSDGVVLPDAKVVVVHDWVADGQAQHRLAKCSGILLPRELGRVHADDDQLADVLAFQFPQLRNYMDTVDSTEGPEIQEHDLAAQLTQSERPVRVEPVQVSGKLWSIDGAGKALG